MLVAGLDIESTGLDKVKDRPIEVGMTLWTTNFSRGLETRSILVQSDGVKVTDEITEITGINQGMVESKRSWVYTPEEAFDEVLYFVNQAEAIVAFNGRRFDIPMFKAWAKRVGKEWPEKPVIDPYDGDLPDRYTLITPGMRGQELITMCAKMGIYYDAHEAGADVSAMLRLMAKRPFDMVWQRSQSPIVIIQSQQGRSENEKVKKHKFRWHSDMKIWWKAVKQLDLEHLAKQVNNEFPLRERTDLTPEQLDTSDSQ